MKTTRRTIPAIAVFAMLAVACGQYAGVHQRGVATGEATGFEGGAAVAGDGTLDGTTGSLDGSALGGSEAGGSVAESTTGAGGDSSLAGGGEAAGPGGPVRGITATEIRIGIHAPLSGAAPISPASFREGKDIYWENGNNGKPVRIFGRKIVTFFEDDQYNPTHARDVCKKMVEQDKVFLLLGGGGTDQINACANYAAGAGVPYMSAGVTEVGMKLKNYFAVSTTYPDQVPIIAKYIREKFTKDQSKIAMVATDTPFFDDAVEAFKQQFPNATVFKHSKNERGASMAQNLCRGTLQNYEVVFPLVAPVYYLEMAGAAKCQPQYVGVGVTMGLDTVARTGCQDARSTEGALFLSPGPAFADAAKYDKDFVKAGGQDDIVFLLWGFSQVLHQMFLKTGEQNLHPAGFVGTVERSSFTGGVYPDLHFSPSNHFGAKQAYMLENVCTNNGGHYVTKGKLSA